MRAPAAGQAHDALVSALQDQANWEARAKAAKDLLNEMLQSRREAADLARHYDIRYTPSTMQGPVVQACTKTMLCFATQALCLEGLIWRRTSSV